MAGQERHRTDINRGHKAAALVVLATVTFGLQLAIGAGPGSARPVHAGCDTASLKHSVRSVSDAGGVVILASRCTYVLRTVDNRADGGTGLPVITGRVELRGSGATIARSAAAGTPRFRFFDVAKSARLTIVNTTLHNGSAPVTASGYGGGAIDNHGALVVIRTRFTGNSARSHEGTSGGAIDNAGRLRVVASTFTRNSAQEGGAIFVHATATIIRSTFTANRALDFGGGALLTGAGTTTIVASTFANNIATDRGKTPHRRTLGGGAIDNDARLHISNSTFSGNAAGSNGGGAIQNFGSATITASTLSGNTSAVSGADIHTVTDRDAKVPVATVVQSSIIGGPGAHCGGNVAVTDAGYNLDTGRNCGFTAAHHSSSKAAAKLRPLARNGGPTRTMALRLNSAAINAIPRSASACLRTDQRGVTRPKGAGCDIGAFERVPHRRHRR